MSASADAHEVLRVAAELRAAGHDLADLTPAATEAGRAVLAASRPPRRSGALAASLRADASAKGVTFASSARYWTFVHFGAPRRHIRAQPWFPQAVDAATSDVLRVYEEHAARAIDNNIT